MLFERKVLNDFAEVETSMKYASWRLAIEEAGSFDPILYLPIDLASRSKMRGVHNGAVEFPSATCRWKLLF